MPSKGRSKSSSRAKSRPASKASSGSASRASKGWVSTASNDGANRTPGQSSSRSTKRGSRSRSGSRPFSTAQLLGVLAIIAVILGAVWFFNRSADPVRSPAEVTVEQAYNSFQEGAFLLDVREPSEWEEFHVEGATLIPLGELASRSGELPADREIVVICRSGNRSAEGRDILLGQGFEQVTSVAGGMNEWRAAGYPVVENQP